jgi:hypothetical protein
MVLWEEDTGDDMARRENNQSRRFQYTFNHVEWRRYERDAQ